MFKSKIVFVIGAGGSQEVGLPCGNSFKEAIAERLNIVFQRGADMTSGDGHIVAALREKARHPDGRAGDINPFRHASLRIRNAMPQATSIDFFLDHHREDSHVELCGKLSIVRTILCAEERSRLFVGGREPRNIDFKKVEGTWYGSLWKILTAGASRQNLDEIFRNVSFVIFNYDRCVEQFFYYSLQNYSGLSADEAASVMRNVKIFHPYGTVGSLPWQHCDLSIEFGDYDLEPTKLLAVANKIKTFTERVGDGEDIAEMQSEIALSNTLVFLGFAFHQQNLTLMKPRAFHVISKNVYGTTYKISIADRPVIERGVITLHGDRAAPTVVSLKSMTCHELFDEYWHHLSQT